MTTQVPSRYASVRVWSTPLPSTSVLPARDRHLILVTAWAVTVAPEPSAESSAPRMVTRQEADFGVRPARRPRSAAPAATWDSVAAHLQGRPVWLAAAHGALPYDRVDWTAACALIIGSEAAGLSAEADGLGTGHVTIPMAAPVESLNAAMAATVLLFEAARQRRQQDGRSLQS